MIDIPEVLYESEGCIECRNTGYLGRTGVYEFMPITNELRSMISDNIPSEKLAEQSYKLGMQPLKISIANLLKTGKTTIDEALKLVPPDF